MEGGDVAPGELLELLSQPQESEGAEGVFVLVRKPNGMEGWCPTRHLAPP